MPPLNLGSGQTINKVGSHLYDAVSGALNKDHFPKNSSSFSLGQMSSISGIRNMAKW